MTALASGATSPTSQDPTRRRPEWLAGLWLIAPTLAIVIGMMLVPLCAIVIVSFWTQTGFDLDTSFTLANYGLLVDDALKCFSDGCGLYSTLIIKSLWISFVATSAVVLLAYPMAYFMAFRIQRGKLVWIILLTVPFWTSYLLRVFAWKVILGFNGVINSGLKSLGLIEKPLEFLLYNPASVTITLAHAWAAYAVLPIYVSLEKIDRSYLEAATDLGDSRWKRFWRVTFPLSLPGTIAAILLVFIPTVGDYITPTLVGGPSGIMIGNSIATQFIKANNAPLGAALSCLMMLAITLAVCLFLAVIGKKRLKGADI
ncbi:spermidine/putrescine transport system permease protein [Dongia mobilis]|uniref:Spermidine/putrescine transport system permease protein n=1 Tax=Dongia mobilis TaxID=578943 RepID=A0A4R6WQL5_9PROT|nr:ABC transporter permease [Dongia mobilis]TDQ78832.1 spermidine/putrescine transport system permease protein [Dongia mobilis]